MSHNSGLQCTIQILDAHHWPLFLIVHLCKLVIVDKEFGFCATFLERESLPTKLIILFFG